MGGGGGEKKKKKKKEAMPPSNCIICSRRCAVTRERDSDHFHSHLRPSLCNSYRTHVLRASAVLNHQEREREAKGHQESKMGKKPRTHHYYTTHPKSHQAHRLSASIRVGWTHFLSVGWNENVFLFFVFSGKIYLFLLVSFIFFFFEPS